MAANSEKTARGRGRPFEKGKSGNPNGRPKQTQEEKDALAMIKDLAPDAALRLRDIIHNPDVRVDLQLKAIEVILDRTYGKGYANEKIKGDYDDPLRELFRRMDEDVNVQS